MQGAQLLGHRKKGQAAAQKMVISPGLECLMSLHSDLSSEYFVDVVKSHFHTALPRAHVQCVCVCVCVCTLPVDWQSWGITQLHDCTLPLKKKKSIPSWTQNSPKPFSPTQYFRCIHSAIGGNEHSQRRVTPGRRQYSIRTQNVSLWCNEVICLSAD